MTTTRVPRDRQRGNSLLLALIVMSALATLGSLTVVSVQSSLKTSTNERSQAVAMYAAESGAAIAMDFLRANFLLVKGWSAYVKPGNDPNQIVSLGAPTLPSSGAQPGTADNPFSADQNAWYSVMILNNRNDPGFAAGTDTDGQVIIQSTGNGPQGSVAIIEWEVQRIQPVGPPAPLPAVPATQPLILLGWHVVL